jgi:hypothetical protein
MIRIGRSSASAAGRALLAKRVELQPSVAARRDAIVVEPTSERNWRRRMAIPSWRGDAVTVVSSGR